MRVSLASFCSSCSPQAKYEAMMTKQAFDSLRNRLKFEKLAGKHMELQAEYEALRDSLRTNDYPSGRSKVGTLERKGFMPIGRGHGLDDHVFITNITGFRGRQSSFRCFRNRTMFSHACERF